MYGVGDQTEAVDDLPHMTMHPMPALRRARIYTNALAGRVSQEEKKKDIEKRRIGTETYAV
jgi:hypothetical protein